MKLALERSANGSKGRGPRLLVRVYLDGEPWEELSDRDKRLIRKTERAFRTALVEAGFLADPDRRR